MPEPFTPMRILYVLPSLLMGGAESLVAQWAGYLTRAGHQVEVCTLFTGGPFARTLERQGVCVHNLNFDPGIEEYRLRRKYDPRVTLALKSLILSGDYQVVHAHLFPGLIHAGLVSCFNPKRLYIYSEHSVMNRRRSIPLLKNVDRLLYSRFHRIVPVSEMVSRALKEWLPDLDHKIDVVPNSVDAGRFSSSEKELANIRKQLSLREEERVALFVGRMIPAKGPDLLIKALLEYRKKAVAPLRALFVGDGPLRDPLKHKVARSTSPVRVNFLGNRSDVPLLLNLADVLVLPSRWEGLPMVLLEAIAAQTPVLATRVGGIPEVLVHGESGWLVPPEDPFALSEGLRHLLTYPELSKRFRSNAFEVFKANFSPQATMPRLLEIYSSAQ